MKVVLAIDSFKGSMSCTEAAEAAALGIKDVYPDAECVISPIADGGEGTVDAIVCGAGGEYRSVTVSDPLGRKISARYGYLPSGCAIIEMAAAAGITLVGDDGRDPLKYDTYGVGEMIVDAMAHGAHRFIIGLGGSATNDGGVGMLRALGFKFLDKRGEPIERGASGIFDIEKIDITGAMPALSECEFIVASDVKNPLTGEGGATYVFGGQKGVTDEMKPKLDKALLHFAELTREVIPSADPDIEGAGAAGGMGFALVGYLGAEIRRGIDLVMEITGFADKVKDADFVITGEGRMDSQSAMGKVPVGVARVAKIYGKPVIALAGSVLDGAEALSEHGIDAIFPILRSPATLKEAMDRTNAERNMRAAARSVFSLIRALKNTEKE